MSRSLRPWVGATDDAAIPARVRVRVFERYGGRCYLTSVLIRPGDAWDCDHIVALINGGRHAEDNLAPALRDKHRAKSREDVAEKSAAYESRKRHLGLKKAKHPMPGSKASGIRKRMNGTVERW